MTEVYDLYDEYIYIDGHWERIGGGGEEIPIDDALSPVSENPVQNKIITAALNAFATSSDLDAAVAAQAIVNEELIELLGHAGIIDDTQISNMTTWSSSKFMSEIENILGDIETIIDAINGGEILPIYIASELTNSEIDNLDDLFE